MNVPPLFTTFWSEFVQSTADPEATEARFYEACRFGHTTENASKTAALILAGEKTATGSLLSEFEVLGKPLPEPGALTIVVDGHDQAVGVIETVEVNIVAFSDVGARFAYDYGEGDRSLGFWHTAMWRYYAEECERLGVAASEEMPLVCEYFRLVHTATPKAPH